MAGPGGGRPSFTPGDLYLNAILEDTVSTASNKWYEIGIALGIESHVLDRIRTDHWSSQSKCSTEMIREWLKSGTASPMVWLSAMRSPTVGLDSLANRLERIHQRLQPETRLRAVEDPQVPASQEPLSPEYTAFIKCYPDVVMSISYDIGSFVDELYSQGFISEVDRDYSSTIGIPNSDKARRLTNALTNRIKHDPSVFHRLLELDNVSHPSRADLVQKLRKCLEEEKLKTVTSTVAENASSTAPGKPRQVPASQEPLSPEYIAFRKCFENVVATIKQDIKPFCDQLFMKNYISEADRDYVSVSGIPDSDKARRLAVAINDRIKQDPTVFHRFLELVQDIVDDPFRNDLIQKMRQYLKKEQFEFKFLATNASSTATGTLKSDDFDALAKIFHDEQLKIDLTTVSSLEELQQVLREMEHHDLATKLQERIARVTQEQKERLKRLDNLMTSKDTIFLCYLKLFAVGPPNTGKSTTISRLMRQFLNLSTATEDQRKRRSTLLANCSQVLAFVGESTSDWKAVSSLDDEAQLLIDYLLCTSNASQTAAVQVDQTNNNLSLESPTIDTDSFGDAQGVPDSHEQDKSVYAVHKPPDQNSKILRIKMWLQECSKTGKYKNIVPHLGNTLLNIIDVGGQPGFLEMLPALSSGPAMYLVFTDLSKEFDKPYEISFDRDGITITPYKSVHTVKATLSQILSSIASSQHTSIVTGDAVVGMEKALPKFCKKLEKFNLIRPMATLIGTHLDEVKKTRVTEVHDEVKTIIQPFRSVIFDDSTQDGSQPCLFPVNNLTGDESDIGTLRDFLGEVFSTHFKESGLPVKNTWVLLNIILRKEFCIAKLDDCIEIGKSELWDG